MALAQSLAGLPCILPDDSIPPPMPPQSPELARWFADEVAPHEESLRAYLRVSAPTPADIDDLVQESFLRLIRLHESSTVRCPRALLFAIARNAIRDAYRRGRLRNHVPITENEARGVLDHAVDVVDQVTRRQEQALLAEALRELPDRTREILLLRKIQGLSQKEISARLSISINTVESTLSRGLRRVAHNLRRLYQERT